MESDYKEEPSVPSTSPSSNDEILKIITAISSQMVVGHKDLQNQLLSSNQTIQAELQKVREENEKFKQEMWAELSSVSSYPTTNVPILASLVSIPSTAPVASVSTSDSSADFQSQMLAVLNDTFSKL
jgi:hypothetical protein